MLSKSYYVATISASVIYQSMIIKGDMFNVLFLVLWAKSMWVQGTQTAVLLHGPVVKYMVSYLKSRGLVGMGSDR
jgi:hypothetical protein